MKLFVLILFNILFVNVLYSQGSSTSACEKIVIYRFEWGKTDAKEHIEITPTSVLLKTNKSQKVLSNSNDTINQFFLSKSPDFYANWSNFDYSSNKRSKYSYQLNYFSNGIVKKYLLTRVYDWDEAESLNEFEKMLFFVNRFYDVKQD